MTELTKITVAEAQIGDTTITITHYPEMTPNEIFPENPPYGCYFCNMSRTDGSFTLNTGGSWAKALGEFNLEVSTAISRLNKSLQEQYTIREAA